MGTVVSIVLSFLAARLKENSTKAALAAAPTAFLAAVLAGGDPISAAVAFVVGVIVAVVPEAKPVIDDLEKIKESVPPPSPPSPLSAPLKASVVALLFATGLSLQACSSLTPGEVQALQVACKVDALAQPVMVQLASDLAPQLGPLVATDQALVHPAVVAACAAIGGKAVVVTATTK